MRRFGWIGIVGALLVVLLLGGGTAAALCKFTLDCGLRTPPPPPTALDDFAEDAGLAWELPEGFTGSTLVTGLRNPTDFAFLTDGRVVVAEKAGLLRTIADGAIEARPFLDIRSKVNDHFFRGVVDVAVDPDFDTNPYVYVTYAERGPGGVDSTEPIVVRLSRFEVRDGVAVRASEKVIVGADGVPGTSCRALPETADCIPADGDHIGADVVFGSEGSIFLATGDGGGGPVERVEPVAFRAQDEDTLGGKILRIDREGRGLPGNPFWSGDATANRSKVWATGLRNPFRMTLVPGRDDALIVADVGWDTYEELNVVEAGKDYGWPCFEGPERTPGYRDYRFCTSYYDSATPESAWLPLPHPMLQSISGGVSLESAPGWPERYRAHYLFGDWLKSELRIVPLDADSSADEPELFARNAGGPVAFALRDDGSVYYLAVNVGELRVIRPE